MKLRRISGLFLMVLIIGLIASGNLFAQYPEKPINMIIAFSAGGSSDVQARIMQKYWNKYSDQEWVFVYKPGAGGAIGFGEIAHAKADGYTIGGVNVPHIVLQPLMQHAQFDIDDFRYICQVVNDPQCVVVRKDSELKTVKDVFDYATANPNKLKVGLVGPNSGHHLMFLDVKDKYDFPVTEIFYKGAADQNAALLGGEIDVMFGNLNDAMRSRDEMNVLGMASEKRNAFMPDVPTLLEQNYDIVSDIRRAFVAPKGIDEAKLDYLREIFKKISDDPEYQADMKTAGQPMEYLDGEAFAAHVKKQKELAKTHLQKAGILK